MTRSWRTLSRPRLLALLEAAISLLDRRSTGLLLELLVAVALWLRPEAVPRWPRARTVVALAVAAAAVTWLAAGRRPS